MASFLRRREGQGAAGQSSFGTVQEDDRVPTRSFRSKKDVDDDLCAVNGTTGAARGASGRLEDQQSPTSVAARRAYDASGLGRNDAQRNALDASPSGGSDSGAPVRPPPQKRKKDGPSGRDADAEPSAGATLALASRGDDTRGDVPFGNEPFAAHCRRAALIVKQYPDQPDVLSLGQVLASQVTRVGLPKALALKDAGVVAGWGRFREYEAEVASLRGVCERKLGERIMLSTLQVESLEHLADHVQVNIMFFDPTWGKNGDEKNVGQRCYTYVVRDVYQEAAAIGVISADDALRLSEGQFVADTMPFAMDVSRNGKRLRPHVELLRLCSDEEELRDKLLDTHHKAVTAAVWTLTRARRLMGKDTCIVGWGLEGSEFAIRLGQETGGDYLGSLFHPEQLKNAKQDVLKLLEAGRDVAILSHAGMLCCQHVFQSIAYFRDVTLFREMTLFLEYYDKNSVGYQLLREARSKASEELWLDDRYREKVIKGLAKYWASPAGIARRKEMSKEAYLAPRRANGFGDGEEISAGASRRSAALLDVFIT